MEKQAIVQRIINDSPSAMDVAIKYYSIVSSINSLSLTQRELQLLAFIATRGSISVGGAKELFGQLYGSSAASIGNMVWKLSKKGLLIKRERKTILHPALTLDFNSSSIVLNLTLNNGSAAES